MLHLYDTALSNLFTFIVCVTDMEQKRHNNNEQCLPVIIYEECIAVQKLIKNAYLLLSLLLSLLFSLNILETKKKN